MSAAAEGERAELAPRADLDVLEKRIATRPAACAAHDDRRLHPHSTTPAALRIVP